MADILDITVQETPDTGIPGYVGDEHKEYALHTSCYGNTIYSNKVMPAGYNRICRC